MKVGIVTLGCDKNTVDNEYLAGQLSTHGVQIVRAGKEPDENLLDAVLINTCGFIDAAKQESIRTILNWVEHKKQRAADGERLRVLVAGCLTQRYKESLVAELPEVDGFMGVGDFDKVVQLVKAPADTSSQINLIDELPAVPVRDGMPRVQLGPVSPHAFIKIADGCNHNCTFCAIPSFKGRLQSVKREIILAEARLLLSRGVREINIVAQDTSDYGKDIYGREYGIADLLAELAALPGDFWIRLFYFYPGGVTDKFLEVMGSSPKIARYIDMPLQHLHPEVLLRMKRPYKEVNTFDRIARLRAASPGLALRTTFIVGFPGETEEHFEYLMNGIGELRFNRMGAFPFSIEEGTPSADFKPRVPERLKKARFDQLMRRQAEISRELHESRVGEDIKVLVEGRLDDGRYVSRGEADAPEVDGTVIISTKQDLRIGDFAQVRVTGAETYDLLAEV
ncbi:MAG: 30S ribosomal protein S12 methylthiotransferase RimO [Candidatus Sumerlaeaceae bacterium]|nr:30S ribosomal protein S12 methylthiotransferase RimO [Candidatus Sumerlaeaceae bacterium]